MDIKWLYEIKMTMVTMKGVEGIIKSIRRAGLKGRRTPECQREQKENRQWLESPTVRRQYLVGDPNSRDLGTTE